MSLTKKSMQTKIGERWIGGNIDPNDYNLFTKDADIDLTSLGYSPFCTLSNNFQHRHKYIYWRCGYKFDLPECQRFLLSFICLPELLGNKFDLYKNDFQHIFAKDADINLTSLRAVAGKQTANRRLPLRGVEPETFTLKSKSWRWRWWWWRWWWWWWW